MIDRFGTRIGYALAIGIWSLAAMGHALAGGVLGFAVARFALGLGESANFPAAIKAVAEWFPQRERALAAGIFNSGSNIGALVAPALVPVVVVHLGWQAAFLFTGVLSMAWLITWLVTYRTPDQQPKLSAAEREYIGHEPATTTRLPWLTLLRHRQTWAFAAAKFITDPIWWFFLFWLPKFLHSEYGLTLLGLGLPLVAIYLCAGRGQHRWWVACGSLHQARLERESRAQDHHADLRAGRGARGFRRESGQPVGGSGADRPRHRRTPGLVGEHLHADFGSLPARGSRFGGRHRWFCRRRQRHADLDGGGTDAGCHRQLRAGVPDGRLGVSHRVVCRASAGTAPAAGYHQAMSTPTRPLTLHEDRLFPPDAAQRAIARRLHAQVAKLPIISPHGHTDPQWFAGNEPFANATELLLVPDHYLFRMLYSQGIALDQLGIPRRDGSRAAVDPRAAWRVFAENFHLFRGTPSALWLNHVFHEVFGLRVRLDADTADAYYDTITSRCRRRLSGRARCSSASTSR